MESRFVPAWTLHRLNISELVGWSTDMSMTELHQIEGVVKWFDARKGYGFIVGPEGQDIFVHFSVIEQTEGFRTLHDNERVAYSAAVGPKGWSATRARSLTRVTQTAGNG